MKLNKKQLPIFAAFVQTAQYALAGFFLIGNIGWFFVGSMGALVSLAMAYGSSQFSDIAKNRKTGALISLIGLMCLSPIVVGTATWLHLTNIVNPYWRGVVSFAWGVLPDGAVVLAGFIAGKGLFEQSNQPKKKQQGNDKPKTARKVAGKQKSKQIAIAQEELTNDNLIAYVARNTKDGKKPSQGKIAAHFGVSRQAIQQRLERLQPIDVTQELKK